MNVKLLSHRCGHSPAKKKDGPVVAFGQSIGEIIDVPDDEAKRMVDSGLAEYVKNADGREKRG